MRHFIGSMHMHIQWPLHVREDIYVKTVELERKVCNVIDRRSYEHSPEIVGEKYFVLVAVHLEEMLEIVILLLFHCSL